MGNSSKVPMYAAAATLGLLCTAVVFGTAGNHGGGTIEFFNFGDAIGVTNPNVPKFTGIRSTVDPGHFETGSSEGEPVPVTSVGKDAAGNRRVDDGTGKPTLTDKNNEGKPVIDESQKDAPLAKVQPNQRAFSAANGNGQPGLAMAEFDGDTVKTVTLKDGTKIDFTGKGVTDEQISGFLQGKPPTLQGNNGTVKAAQDASGKSVTCQG